MSQLVVNIPALLSETGDIHQIEGVLPLDAYQVGGQSFALKDGVSYQLQLLHTGEEVVLSGSFSTQVQGNCVRCLEPAEFELQGDVEGWYLFEAPGEETDLEDDEYELIPADGEVDLAVQVQAALVLETPLMVLCHEDCAGLCPSCGANLNEEDCSCANEPNPDSPFAALKDFKFEDNK